MASQLWRTTVFLALGAAAIAAASQQRDLPSTILRLERENAALEKEIELAGDRLFYLVLDPAVPDLTLVLRGAELRRYPVLALSVGVPRVAFIRRGGDEAWQNVIFSGGRLDPPRELDRLEVVPPPADATGEAVKAVIPPTPEEAYPVPLRYRIRFDKGPSIEIRPREADATSRWARVSTWWGARWRDTLAALAPPDDEIVRIRIALAPQDAYMLYRSLPPDSRLLVRAGTPETGPEPVALQSHVSSWRSTVISAVRMIGASFASLLLAAPAWAQGVPAEAPARHGGGEASLVLPDLTSVTFLGLDGWSLLALGLIVCALGLVFGLTILGQLKRLPVHGSMAEISDLIWETCKTYLITQGKFILVLEAFIGTIILLNFGVLMRFEPVKVVVILIFSLIGIGGSYGIAWFGIRVNTYANSRTSFASLAGRPLPLHSIPIKAGMSIGMLLISVELLMMLCILLFIPADYAGPCFIGFAIGESMAAAALRIAGGIFTKIADIGSDLMKIVFNIKEDDARNPGVIADCTGDNAGDSVGPSADGFETYGVTGVALITFIVIAVGEPAVQVQFLVWIFMMRVTMIVASGLAYLVNERWAHARYGRATEMDFEAPLTSLVWVTSFVSVALTYLVSWLLIRDLGDGTLWWKLSTIITCGTLAGAIIPELVKVFTSTQSGHVREILSSSKEGGASLNILSGFVAGNFSAFWLGMSILTLMGVAYFVSLYGLAALMVAPAVFAFGLVAFGFLGMGPVTIAVDSYGPVTDNAQSVFELSLIEQVPGIKDELKRTHGIDVDFARAKHLLESNDGAGNTFKATAKPVLIGTAVVGATTMIFSIIVLLTQGLTVNLDKLSLLHPPFLLGLITGGCVIYWFTGASMQAVTTGAHRAVEFIKANIRLEGVTRASVTDSKRVVEICTQYAQRGMFNIFLTVFFATLAFAFFEPYFFIGYLISIALFGLTQAIFMANAGGAWDNAKKIVEVELQQKGTELHAATVVGDTVGDPFKDTSSVAMNPIIKFTTLFGLLAVELAVMLAADAGTVVSRALATVFFIAALLFVHRSFYGMRIAEGGQPHHVPVRH